MGSLSQAVVYFMSDHSGRVVQMVVFDGRGVPTPSVRPLRADLHLFPLNRKSSDAIFLQLMNQWR